MPKKFGSSTLGYIYSTNFHFCKEKKFLWKRKFFLKILDLCGFPFAVHQPHPTVMVFKAFLCYLFVSFSVACSAVSRYDLSSRRKFIEHVYNGADRRLTSSRRLVGPR